MASRRRRPVALLVAVLAFRAALETQRQGCSAFVGGAPRGRSGLLGPRPLRAIGPPLGDLPPVPKFFWVQVEGAARADKVSIEGISDVADLCEEIKRKFPDLLGSASAANLDVYESKAAQMHEQVEPRFNERRP